MAAALAEGNFEICGGVLTLPDSRTVQVLSGRIVLHGRDAWGARLQISPDRTVPTRDPEVADNVWCYLQGQEFIWSGDARTWEFNAADSTVYLAGLDAPTRHPRR